MLTAWWQNAANQYDIDANGVADGADAYFLDQELRAHGERVLTAPNGPVQHYWDVDGDNQIRWIDQVILLHYLTGTLEQHETNQAAKDAELTESGGGISSMSGYEVSLNPVGNVAEGTAFDLTGSVSPPGSYLIEATINWGLSPGNGSQGSIGTAPDGSFTVPHIYFDDGPAPGNGTPSDGETITLSGTILDSAVYAETNATVHNVIPAPELVLTNDNSPVGGPRWEVSGSIPGPAGMTDLHTVTIHWGDGSPPTVLNSVPTNQTFNTEPPHRYLPRQIHEGPIPYLMTVTVVDDDTGAAPPWQPQVPQYVLDLDNDANNNDLIEPADDPIEHYAPGRYLTVNMDDDNANGIVDHKEVIGPFPEEDDLEPLHIGWAPRPGFNYTDWRLVLTMDPAPYLDQYGQYVSDVARFYTSPDKAVLVPFEPTAEGPGFDWVIGSEPIPPVLYIESLSPARISLQLSLRTPQSSMHVDEDLVVFLAPLADLDTDSDNNHVLEESDLEDLDEADGPPPLAPVPGKIIRKNTDDDNENGVQDRLDPGPFEDAMGNPVNDDDLKPIKLKVGPGLPDLAGYTVTLVPSGEEIKIWKTHDKQPTLLAWAVAEMPAVLYVEGIEFGQPTLEIQLKNPAGAVVAKDIVKFTVITVDAIAYRPFSFFSPLTTGFIPVPVPFAEEATGVGIRRNGDGDVDPKDENGNPIGEDDLIRVDLDVGNGPAPWPPPGVGRKVGRSSALIDVWVNDNRTGAILTGAIGDLADVPAGSQTVYVDWPSSVDGAPTFEFSVWDTLHNNKALWDEVVFKPFKSIVIIFVGELEDPTDPPQNGTSTFAVEEYQKSGLDVHLFDENDVAENGSGPPYNEIVTAIKDRGVKNVAIMGYSHGGGSTYHLATRLEKDRPGLVMMGHSFDIGFTSYIDAIVNDDETPTASEIRRPCTPAVCKFHLNQYQRNLPPVGLRGDRTTLNGGADEEEDRTTTTNHLTIDDNGAVHDELREWLREKVKPFLP